MRIIHIIPGSGSTFYCQNCLRDLALVRAFRRQGHDVILVPLYLPLDVSDPSSAPKPAFYSAVSLYIRHQYPRLSRWMPSFFWRAIESAPVLRFAAHMAGSTRATGLFDLTISMLEGEDGRQAEELERLVTWLREDESARPDLVCLSSALLLGLARRIRSGLGVPVVCWLQDEHVWADAMRPEDSARVWQVLRERAADVDGFVAVSHSYADRMRAALSLPTERVRAIHIGVDPSAYRPADLSRTPRTIGFLSRLAEGEGFGRFVDAFIELHRDPRFADVRMKATGGTTDTRYVRLQLRRLRAAGLADRVEIVPDAFQGGTADFLASLTMLSVPVPNGEAFGTYVIEAMAAGVPVVEPPVGAYSEIFHAAGCGVLSASAEPAALARAWADLLSDPARLAEEGARGREAVARVFNLDAMARAAWSYYRSLAELE